MHFVYIHTSIGNSGYTIVLFTLLSYASFFACHTIVPWTTIMNQWTRNALTSVLYTNWKKNFFLIYGSKVIWHKTTCKPFLHRSGLQDSSSFKPFPTSLRKRMHLLSCWIKEQSKFWQNSMNHGVHGGEGVAVKTMDVISLISQFSVQFSRSVVSNSLWPHELEHARPPCSPPTPGVYPKLMSIESVMPSSHLILYELYR